MARLLQWRSLANLALQLAILTLLIAVIFVVREGQVSGLSMAPNIVSGEYVLINALAYRFTSPAPGDVVAFGNDDRTHELFIKRVIALGGDRVRVERGTVYVDGRKLDEPYVRYADTRSFPEVAVPQGSIYVLGDNRADSDDSRFFGPVPENRIVGRALAGIWPPGFMRAL